MNILFVGDIVGRPGRDLIQKGLRGLVEHHDIDCTIANAENSAAGFGITRDIGDAILDWGVDVMTSGNHIWDKKEALEYIGTEPRLLRPANYPAGVPGRGSYVVQTRDGRSVGVVNVMGRVFMTPLDDPFVVVLREIESIRQRERDVIANRERIRRRQRSLGRRTSPRQTVERRLAVQHEVVAVRRIGCDTSRLWILRI